MEESIVKVEHLSHRYSVQWAIRDINFEITKMVFMDYSALMEPEIHDHEYHVRGVKTDRRGCLYKRESVLAKILLRRNGILAFCRKCRRYIRI